MSRFMFTEVVGKRARHFRQMIFDDPETAFDRNTILLRLQAILLALVLLPYKIIHSSMPASQKQPKGTCSYCAKDITLGVVSKHLDTCAARQAALAQAEARDATPEKLYHLLLQSATGPKMWLDLEMRGTMSLADLDFYLRTIWLECCGHLSEFTVGGRFSAPVHMERKIEAIFQSDQGQVHHVYDFGTNSVTVVKCVGVRVGKPITTNPIVLQARNKMEAPQCSECVQPATCLCHECVNEHDETGFLCNDHKKDHPHKNYGEPVPLINSPRSGVCGYLGPGEPPY
jgi:hypothetical protein